VVDVDDHAMAALMALNVERAPFARMSARSMGSMGLSDRLTAMPALLDHLVGARQNHLRHRKAERLGGPEVDHQFKLGRLQHRQVGGHEEPRM
jgi:hypothetical protein